MTEAAAVISTSLGPFALRANKNFSISRSPTLPVMISLMASCISSKLRSAWSCILFVIDFIISI